ncbi:MAG: hypothetical protein IJ315_05630 [Firmicutes bacterium]|nr:hypothetical protein [Bacillota bacterium]
MFGYISVNRQELKVRELERYRAFYCGLCENLRTKYGLRGQITLTYDMTFLVILLSSLYEPAEKKRHARCLVHPAQKHCMVSTKATSYAADMNILLTYEHLMDDWMDEKSVPSRLGAILLQRKVKKLQSKYQHKAMIFWRELKALHKIEAEKETSLDAASGCFGRLMAELFAYKKDAWEPYLRNLGFYLGKFIYMMDAFDDYEKDEKSGSYNVLRQYENEQERQEKVQEALTMMIAECAQIIEFLPLMQDDGILKNIIYSGVWTRWNQKLQEKKEGERKNG